MLISPIIDWTDDDVWTFLNTLQIEHCELYDQGWKRIGCIGCPMSSAKQKIIENKRWPHVKRNWIKAIKAIRTGGGIQRRIYLVEHPQGLDASCECQSCQTIHQPNSYQKDIWRAKGSIGFSDSSSSDRLTEEQENEIAENIYDWWISGKSYQKWYAEKFQQQNLGLE